MNSKQDNRGDAEVIADILTTKIREVLPDFPAFTVHNGAVGSGRLYVNCPSLRPFEAWRLVGIFAEDPLTAD